MLFIKFSIFFIWSFCRSLLLDVFSSFTVTVTIKDVDDCKSLRLVLAACIFDISTFVASVFNAFAIPVLTWFCVFVVCIEDVGIFIVIDCWIAPNVVILQNSPENGTSEQSHENVSFPSLQDPLLHGYGLQLFISVLQFLSSQPW